MADLKDRGTVKVVDGRFQFKGKFHYIYPNTPIRDENGELKGVTNPRDMTYVHMYGGETPFFDSLKNGKLFGTRCDNPDCEHTGTVHVHFKIHCPECLKRNTIVDITEIAKKTATVHTFMVTERTGAFNTLDKPIRFINIEFEAVSTILMGYLPVGEPQVGMRVL
ncbi:MAG: hypothetical protein V3U02_03600, partial [Calditrichia bacterium]